MNKLGVEVVTKCVIGDDRDRLSAQVRQSLGRSAILILNGQLDQRAIERESLTREELLSVIHRQGFEDFHQVHKCQLDPNGTFYVEAFDPSVDDKRHAELLSRIDALAREVASLRPQPAVNPGS